MYIYKNMSYKLSKYTLETSKKICISSIIREFLHQFRNQC